MLSLLSQTLGQVILASCFAFLNLAFFCLTGLIRLLPQLARLGHQALRAFFVQSSRAYELILVRLAPFAEKHLRIDLLGDAPRLGASILLSLTLGLLVAVIAGWRLSVWTVGLPILHGLAVGLRWNEIDEPQGFRLGSRIQ
jgi:hypothetical protein